MTIERDLDAYRRGELTLGEVLEALPVVSDGSLELIEFLDALDAGRVPAEVVEAWSHPDGRIARRAHHHRHRHGPADSQKPTRAWKFLPKALIDEVPRVRRLAPRKS